MRSRHGGGELVVLGYHGIDTERLHSSAHPRLVVGMVIVPFIRANRSEHS